MCNFPDFDDDDLENLQSDHFFCPSIFLLQAVYMILTCHLNTFLMPRYHDRVTDLVGMYTPCDARGLVWN